MNHGPPTHHLEGLHILDPHDRLGYKSAYITLLHEAALRRHLPQGAGELAVDLGCGYGRLTPLLLEKGWQALGLDPLDPLISYARRYFPGPEYRVGGLPDLPLATGSISLLLLQNVLRPLKIMNRLHLLTGFGRYLKTGAQVFVVDNLRAQDPAYLSETDIVQIMHGEGLQWVTRIPLRAGRWWITYLIRYGLIPRSWFARIAQWELQRMAQQRGIPCWQYWNVLYVFEK